MGCLPGSADAPGAGRRDVSADADPREDLHRPPPIPRHSGQVEVSRTFPICGSLRLTRPCLYYASLEFEGDGTYTFLTDGPDGDGGAEGVAARTLPAVLRHYLASLPIVG